MRQRLGLVPGAQVDLYLDDRSVIVLASQTPSGMSQEEFNASVSELQAAFAGGTSLEDEFFRDRNKVSHAATEGPAPRLRGMFSGKDRLEDTFREMRREERAHEKHGSEW